MDLYSDFLTNLKRKKRKPRYSSLGLPLLPPEPKPVVDAIGLPIREDLLRERDLLSSKIEWYNLLEEGKAVEAYIQDIKNTWYLHDDKHVVDNIHVLRELERRRRLGIPLTERDWKIYSDLTILTDKTLTMFYQVNPIDIDYIDEAEENRYKHFVGGEGLPHLPILMTIRRDGQYAGRHSAILLRREREGNIEIELYDPSGADAYYEDNRLTRVLVGFDEYVKRFNRERPQDMPRIFIPPTEKSYQDPDYPRACSRMCILRAITPDKTTRQFIVDNFDGLELSKIEGKVAEILNTLPFHGAMYPFIERDLAERKEVIDAQVPRYTRLKKYRNDYKKNTERVAEIDKQLATIPETDGQT